MMRMMLTHKKKQAIGDVRADLCVVDGKIVENVASV